MDYIVKETSKSKPWVHDKVKAAAKMSLISPKLIIFESRKRIILTPDDAKKIINGEIYIPMLKTVEKHGSSWQPRGMVTYRPNVIEPHIEKELWHRVKEGDQSSFAVLWDLVEPVILQVIKKPVFGTSLEDRRMHFMTALFEIVQENSYENGISRFICNLDKIVKRNLHDEQVSWISLDKNLGDGITLNDLVDEKGNLIKKNKHQ